MTAEASARGRSNRVKGATGERDTAKWLRPYFPDARRAVVNGWATKDMRTADPGDIDGTAGIFWSVKNCKVEQINPWMAELEAKRDGRLGLLVVKRPGHASPGSWWVWLTLRDLRGLLGFDDGDTLEVWGSSLDEPCRMELHALMPLLVAANYAQNPVAA